MDVWGTVAAICKILPVIVSFHSGACCAGRKHPTKRKKKKSTNKTSAVCSLQVSMGHTRCHRQAAGPPHAPGSQSLVFVGVEEILLFLSLSLSSISFFLVVLGPWPQGKRAPGTLPCTWPSPSSNLVEWK